MTPTSQRDTVKAQSALKLGNSPGVILQSKIGKIQHDRNQAFAGSGEWDRARKGANGPVSLAVGARREAFGVKRPSSHGRAGTCLGGLRPFPDFPAACVRTARRVTDWFGYADRSGRREISRGNDGRPRGIMGVTGRLLHVAPVFSQFCCMGDGWRGKACQRHAHPAGFCYFSVPYRGVRRFAPAVAIRGRETNRFQVAIKSTGEAEEAERCGDSGTACGTMRDRAAPSRTWRTAPEGIASQGAATIAHGSKAASIASTLKPDVTHHASGRGWCARHAKAAAFNLPTERDPEHDDQL